MSVTGALRGPQSGRPRSTGMSAVASSANGASVTCGAADGEAAVRSEGAGGTGEGGSGAGGGATALGAGAGSAGAAVGGRRFT